MVKKLNQNESNQVSTHQQLSKLKSAIKETFTEINDHAAALEKQVEQL